MHKFDILSSPNKKIIIKTWIGGFLSIASLSILAFLLYKENSGFTEKRILKTIYVDNAQSTGLLRVSLSILFRNCPCYILSLDVHDRLDHHRENIEIGKYRINSEGVMLPDKIDINLTNAQIVEQTIAALASKMGCRLKGDLNIDKISGNFHISFHPFMEAFSELKRIEPDLFLKMNLSYEIETLLFDNVDTSTDINAMKQLIDDLDLKNELFDNFVDHERSKHEQFTGMFWLELMSYSFIDHRSKTSFVSWQHSFNRKIKVDLLARFALGIRSVCSTSSI